jgi:plasmid rolling circle replication initiator protein Rep
MKEFFQGKQEHNKAHSLKFIKATRIIIIIFLNEADTSYSLHSSMHVLLPKSIYMWLRRDLSLRRMRKLRNIYRSLF